MATPTKKPDLRKEAALKRNEKRIPADTVIFQEGATTTEVYLLMDGAVSVLKDGKEIAVIEEPLSYFGEMSALLGEPRSATIKTKTICKMVIFPGNKLDAMVDISPQVGKKLLRTLAARLAEANKKAIAAQNQIRLIKQKFSKEYNTAIQDYKRLIQVIQIAYGDTKYPIIQELAKFSVNNSILAKMGIKTTLSPEHLENFKALSKAFNGAAIKA